MVGLPVVPGALLTLSGPRSRNAPRGSPSLKNEVLADWFLCRKPDPTHRKKPRHGSGAKLSIMRGLAGEAANPPLKHRAAQLVSMSETSTQDRSNKSPAREGAGLSLRIGMGPAAGFDEANGISGKPTDQRGRRIIGCARRRPHEKAPPGSGAKFRRQGDLPPPSSPAENDTHQEQGSASAASHGRNAEPSRWFLCRMADPSRKEKAPPVRERGSGGRIVSRQRACRRAEPASRAR